MNRTDLSIKNSFVSLVAQILTLISQFVMQIIFVRYMTANYIGANGLFANLMNLLSFAELGIGAAITFSLYKPIAEKRYAEIDVLLTFYKKVYRGIGITILIAGAVLAFFVNNFVKSGASIPNIREMFYLYIIGTAVSYFYSYSRSLFIADQKSYINTINQVGTRIVQNIIQIAILIIFQSYFGYLMIQIIGTIFSNWLINRKSKRDYPEISWNSKDKISENILTDLKNNVIGNVSSKIGEIVVNGTDNILLSKYIGLGVVGIYANYALITQGISSIVSQIMNGLIGTLGNVGATESVEKQRGVYYRNLYFVAFVSTLFTVDFFIVIKTFIELVFGDNYVLDDFTALLIAVNMGFTNLRKANLSFTSALGLFWTMRYKSLVEAAVNLIISLYLISQTDLGINAVLLGNIISNLLVNFWWEPLIVFRYGFSDKLRRPLIRYGGYHLFIIGCLWLSHVAISLFPQTGLLSLFIDGILGAVITSILFIGFFSFQKETYYFINLVIRIIKHK